METLKKGLKILILSLLMIASLVQVTYAENYPIPFDLIKEVTLKQGDRDENGNFIWEIQIEDVEYWTIYFPDDGSVAFGQSALMGLYSWGVLSGNEDFLLIETLLGQIISMSMIDGKLATEMANEFLKGPEGSIKKLKEIPATRNLLKV
jgi:hypothetical protein